MTRKHERSRGEGSVALYRHPAAHLWQAGTRTGLTAVLLGAIACADGTSGPLEPDGREGFERSTRIHVVNNWGTLRQRIRTEERELRIVPLSNSDAPSGAASLLMPEPNDEVVLTLRAEVDPPDLGGMTIQATHIALQGGLAFVSYNVQGPVYRGGVDVFDVHKASQPTLISQALFDETDVSALEERSGSLYLATATGDPGFGSPAVLEEVILDRGRLTALSRRVDLPSYAATGVDILGDQVFVTSGDGGDGGLSIFARRTLDLEAIINFRDARAVAVRGNLAIGMKGTPGGLYVVDRNTAQLVATWEPGGANIPESKSTIDLYRNFVLMAAGDGGMKVVSLHSGQTVAHQPAPNVDGIPPEYSVTNAVSSHGNLIFLANGGAGLYVAQLRPNDDDTDAELDLVGKVEFPDGPSVNFVAAKGNVLFVAAGEGGLKIIQIGRNAPVAEIQIAPSSCTDDGPEMAC
jgi:hypothetical protein